MMPHNAHGQTANVVTIAAELVRRQGVSGLMRGYWATNSVWLPWNVLYIAMYEDFKQRLARSAACAEQQAERGGQAQQLPTLWATCGASFSAAAIAAVLTHPLDVIKTRLQVLPSDAKGMLTFHTLLQQLLRSEGPGALWAGVVPRVFTIAPGASLSWMLYEQIKRWLAQKQERPVDC